jgi:hypothetical protein
MEYPSLVFSSSSSISFPLNISENYGLESFHISGNLIGEGTARVYLVLADQCFLVFNGSNSGRGSSLITGYVVLNTSAEESNDSIDEIFNDSFVEEFNESIEVVNDSFVEEFNESIEVVNDSFVEEVNESIEVVNDSFVEEVNESIEVVNDSLAEDFSNEESELPVLVFENACEETCALPALNNIFNFTLTIEVDDGTVLELKSFSYTLQEIEKENNLEDQNNISSNENVTYSKLKKDNDYTAILDSVSKINGSLIITLHHNSTELLVIKIKGNVNQYLISKEEIMPYETSVITIPKYNNEYFRIYVEAKEETI